jgi:hypothetical protein
MDLAQLLADVRRHVPPGAPFGTRWKGSAAVATSQGAHQVAAAARIDLQGRLREQYWCDGLRVELGVLLRLTCPEGECPHAMQVRAQWADFHRRGGSAAGHKALQPQALMAEVPVTCGKQSFTARPARFPCFTPCPNGAHPPLTIEKTGFDLFDDSGCVGGGVTQVRGVVRPRIPSLRAAEAFVLARHLEALAAVGHARDSRPGPPGRSGAAGGADGW